jgi:hypothetical protein
MSNKWHDLEEWAAIHAGIQKRQLEINPIAKMSPMIRLINEQAQFACERQPSATLNHFRRSLSGRKEGKGLEMSKRRSENKKNVVARSTASASRKLQEAMTVTDIGRTQMLQYATA